MRHTPGPWHWFISGNLVGTAENGEPHHLTKCEPLANRDDAKLIATAPDMLELLKEVCEALHDLPADLPTAKSYIKIRTFLKSIGADHGNDY